MNPHFIYESPLGTITLASDGKNICGAWFEGQKHFCAKLPAEAKLEPSIEVFALAKSWFDDYFNGKAPAIPDWIELRGTDFQLQVWNALKDVPYGELCTYGEIAAEVSRAIGRPTSPRAVGQAVGRNPISVIVPCHRVVGANGSLTGYAGGLDLKVALLKLEGIEL